MIFNFFLWFVQMGWESHVLFCIPEEIPKRKPLYYITDYIIWMHI